MFPQLTGFSFFPGPGTLGLANVIANWDVPPAGATGTEFWTSPDNVTYTLFATLPAPVVMTQRSPPAVGSFMWAKARWVSATGMGPFCAAQEVSGRACDWAARVVTNGGATTSVNSRKAMNTLDLAIVSAGIDGQMIWNLPIVSDNLIASLTPLYKVAGNDPATNNGPFVAGDLSVNGLKGDGVAKFLNTGIIPTVSWPGAGNLDLVGMGAYKVTSANGANVELGTAQGGDNVYLQVDDAGGNSNYANDGNTLTGANNLFTGWLEVERTSTTRMDIYSASSTKAWSSIANTNAAAGVGFSNNIAIFAFALNSAGVAANFNAQTLSFLSIHNGLSSAQGQNYFNAVQAFRTTLGGGFV